MDQMHVPKTLHIFDEIDTLNSITNRNCDPLLTHKEITHAWNSDQPYQILLKTITNSFP